MGAVYISIIYNRYFNRDTGKHYDQPGNIYNNRYNGGVWLFGKNIQTNGDASRSNSKSGWA
jgi:hypothetical protein